MSPGPWFSGDEFVALQGLRNGARSRAHRPHAGSGSATDCGRFAAQFEDLAPGRIGQRRHRTLVIISHNLSLVDTNCRVRMLSHAARDIRTAFCPSFVDKRLDVRNSGHMESEQIILALAALAQANSRLETFRLLVRHEPDGLPAGAIADELAVPHNTLSAHLSVLSRAGLVTSRSEAAVQLSTAPICRRSRKWRCFCCRIAAAAGRKRSARR